MLYIVEYNEVIGQNSLRHQIVCNRNMVIHLWSRSNITIRVLFEKNTLKVVQPWNISV